MRCPWVLHHSGRDRNAQHDHRSRPRCIVPPQLFVRALTGRHGAPTMGFSTACRVHRLDTTTVLGMSRGSTSTNPYGSGTRSTGPSGRLLPGTLAAAMLMPSWVASTATTDAERTRSGHRSSLAPATTPSSGAPIMRAVTKGNPVIVGRPHSCWYAVDASLLPERSHQEADTTGCGHAAQVSWRLPTRLGDL